MYSLSTFLNLTCVTVCFFVNYYTGRTYCRNTIRDLKHYLHIAAHCYDEVRKETEEMQTKIQEGLGLSPVEQEVVVLYEGEKEAQIAEFWQGKRIVEMNKPRPSWFSKNLLQKTTSPPSSSTDVKPSELA
uniref:Uncharacterized protein n=1 Tax=Timema genevievae TaxID=629358 RepID=A0A7R9PP42_TIMGE|nr:unnamed protein product [Timema genevievae]